MNRKSSSHPMRQTDNDVQLYVILEDLPRLSDAIKICAVPLRLTRGLIDKLLSRFAPEVDLGRFWQLLGEFGLVIQRNEDEWRFDGRARQYFLDRLEQENPTLAQQIHAAVLDYLEAMVYPTRDEDQDRLQRAYHTIPSNPDAGAGLYWSTYCRIRAFNRFAMLPVLAHLAESQAHWLKDHEQDIRLYRAAALYYEGPLESKQRAAELLASIVKQGAPLPIMVDASFLLATLKERTDRDEAIRLYQQATELGDRLDLRDKDSGIQDHLRLTVAKSFFSLASILQADGDPGELEQAENYYRRGIQIVVDAEPRYEAAQLRRLLGLLQKRGDLDQIEWSIQRISQIERPFRRAFLEEALSKADDIGYLYYAISALNHGLGYERQSIHIEVEQDGAAQLKGTYTLRAMSTLSHIDTYLETVPEADVGVHFEGLESLTPMFTLDFRRVGGPTAQRMEIVVDPPMQPGDRLTYRWMARASAGTFATTREQLEAAGLDHEYVAWHVIAPMRRLEIQVIIPWDQTQLPPRAWFELWRIGHWRATTQAQMAYRAFLRDDPGRVRWHAELKPLDKLQLSLEVNYPWLAMRYVLAWGVPQ